MRNFISILFLALFTACAHPPKYYQVPGTSVEAWTPSAAQVHFALTAAEQYCKDELSDPVRAIQLAQVNYEAEVTLSSDAIQIKFDPPVLDTNAIPRDFKVYGVPYSRYRKQLGAFLENRNGTMAHFIAVQHWLATDILKSVKGSMPFTVYVLVDTGAVGWSTRVGSESERDIPVYSPGPPYFISTARF
jgi:hypothetical protein